MSWRHRQRRIFVSLVREHRPFIIRAARAIAKSDRDLRKDLVQEGMIAAWTLSPQYLRGARDKRRFVRAVIYYRMLRVARKLRGGALAKRLVRIP